MSDQTGYFCISGRPKYGGEFPDLPLIPDEVRAIRTALNSLGLTELFAKPGGDAHSHDQLRKELFTWSQHPTGSAPRNATLVIYATGHGYQDENQWILVPPDYSGPLDPADATAPASLMASLQKRGDLAQVLLILDACGAAPGGEQTLLDTIARARFRGVDEQFDLWILAAARRAETARQKAFSEAFAAALRDSSFPSLERQSLDLAHVMERVQKSLKGTSQKSRIVAGYGESHCRALPNPLYMPPETPTWLPHGWDSASRGVVNNAAPGWYFTGRENALRAVLDHLSGADPAPPLWLTGSHGSGKTAVLGRVITTATAELRSKLPVVARGGVLPSSDLNLAPLDGRGRTAHWLAVEIGRILNLEANGIDDLLNKLKQRSPATTLGVIVDHLEEALDPARVLVDLLVPLSATPAVRVVVGFAGPLPDSAARQIVDLDELEKNGPVSVAEYLRGRLSYGGYTSRQAIDALATISGGCFAVAVTAAEVMLRERVDPLDRARAAAAERLDELFRRTLREVIPIDADAAADVLTSLCSFDNDLYLDLQTWAAMTGRLSDREVSAEDLAVLAPACQAFLTSRGAPAGVPGTLHWRPRHPVRPNGLNVSRVLRYLLDEVRPADSDWGRVPPHLLDVLAAAATNPSSGAVGLLDDPDFLLALARPTMSRLVKAIQGPDHVTRTAVWNSQPRNGEPHQRRFAMALTAARQGLQNLAQAVGPVVTSCGSIEVLWAKPGVGNRHIITALSSAGNPEAAPIVTAHGDGRIVWWDGSSGVQVGQLQLAARITDLRAIETEDGARAVVILADGSVLIAGPDAGDTRILVAGNGELPGPSACHPAGIVALSHGSIIDVLATDGPRWSASLGREVVAMAIGGAAGDPVVWIATLDGLVRRWSPATMVSPRRVALCPNPVRLAASMDGELAVIVDAHCNCTFVGGAMAVSGVPTLERNLRAIQLTADWFVATGGDQHQNWLDTYRMIDGRSARWPLDALPVGLSSHGHNGLVVATSRHLALLRVDPLLGPGGRTAAMERDLG